MIGTEGFSSIEKQAMVECYDFVKQDADRALVAYAYYFPNFKQPHKSMFRLVKYNLMMYGQYDKPRERNAQDFWDQSSGRHY